MQQPSRKLALVAAVVVGLAAAPTGNTLRPSRAVLEARASLPAATFAPGPPSSAAIGGPVINGIPTPFATQPVQGFSAILPAADGSYWVMEDNGYGAKANSADFLLRVYRMTPHWKTKSGGPGTVSVGEFLQLRDPEARCRSRSHEQTGC
jgi:glycerophosphoryl diester phosphodiesterase